MLTIKRYATSTIKSYINLIQSFQEFIGFERPIESLSTKELYNALLRHIETSNYSYSSHKQLISTIRLYLLEIHKKDIDFKPVYPTRRPNTLPVILSAREVKSILKHTINIKHKAMLTTVYALGLRSGELLNLKLENINKQEKLIHIRNSKGQKDRVIPLPDSLREVWKPYYKKFEPKIHLFEGRNGKKYTSASLRNVFQKSAKKAGIKSKVTLHSLRHAYATHLFDNGTDIRMIQKLLGHNNIKTTLIYTHVSKRSILDVKSPLDFL